MMGTTNPEIPPGFVQNEMQTGNFIGYTNPQTGETMSIPRDFSGGQTVPVFQRPELPMINRQDTGLMQSGTGGGIGSFPMMTSKDAFGNPRPTNPYSTGFGMGFQQQPNQQPMGGGKGGGRTEQRIDASSGPGIGKGG